MKISVVIPAHNEEKYLGRCLESIDAQSMAADIQVETIVVLNRCTDKTEAVAKRHGAIVVFNDSKNISAIKNTGVAAASSGWVVTIDADSWMSAGVLAEIASRSAAANALGGGIRVKPERYSLGIATGYGMMLIPAWLLGLSFGLYWFRKVDFDAIGGFSEDKHIAEDVDFLRKLKKHGWKTGRCHQIITSETVITSCRQFDQFGDWHFVRIFANPLKVRRAINGTDREYLDKNWYDVKR